MADWLTLPGTVPADGDYVWIRIKYFYSAPFLAVYDSTNQQFISYTNSIIFPAWSVARWRPAYGPELLLDGGFITGSPWYFSGGFTLGSSEAIFDGITDGQVMQFLDFVQGDQFWLQFDISSAAIAARVMFPDITGGELFRTGPNYYADYADGHHSYIVTARSNSDRFRFYGLNTGSSFHVTNISLRKKL